jgi:hypothetical protein
MRAQRLALATGNNPSVAAHDGDASNLASVKRQEQWASDPAEIKPPKSPHYIAEGATGSAKTRKQGHSEVITA